MAANQNETSENKAKIRDLLEKLRHKLIKFDIINLQGQVIGKIQDFCLDKTRRLYVLVSPAKAEEDTLRLLSSKYIQNVDTANRTLLVDLPITELENLPLYPSSQNRGTERSSTPISVTQTNEMQNFNQTPTPQSQWQTTQNPEEVDSQHFTEEENSPEIAEEEIVRLLEERLVVNRNKRKVGEVIVRKEVETRIVEVPVQREKLIIEQVGEETKQLAEIDLGQGEVTGVELINRATSVIRTDNGYTVTGEFLSPKAASNLLEAIALQKPHGCTKVRVELVVDTPELQDAYQKMFDRCSIR